MSKFLIELPERKEIGDLVGLMADFIDAKYRFTTTLETDDERLARAVAGLTGQILTPEENKGVNVIPGAVTRVEAMKMTDLLDMPVVTSPEIPENMVILARSAENAVAAVVEEPKKRQFFSEHKKLGTTCEICGKPAKKRSTICDDEECAKARQKRWDAEWKARKRNAEQMGPLHGAPAASPDPQADQKEEQPAASPFFSPWTSFRLLDKTGTQMVILDYHSLLTQIWDGILLTGALVQDVSSGKFYEVRGEALEVVSAEAVELRRVAAGRGLMEDTPAAD